MKILPTDHTIGISDDEFMRSRMALREAIIDHNPEPLVNYLFKWQAWTVHQENQNTSSSTTTTTVRFSWNVGVAVSLRFETACLAYATGRALFHNRRYYEAWQHFGLALEETMQGQFATAMTPELCGAFRLRCLVRAQRLACYELDVIHESQLMLSMAAWLNVALLRYAQLFPRADRKEPLRAGEGLLQTAQAILTKHPAAAKAAMKWQENPFYNYMIEISKSSPTGENHVLPQAEFNWTRFTSGKLYSA